jgi:septal ring factor EnvC (AmiA/AmiB activator)
MDQTNMWSVLITAITVLGGTSAFRYYERRALHKERDDEFIRHDCKDRITKLEALLERSSQEKDEMRQQILDLVSEVASLRTEIKYLTDRRTGGI